MEDPYKILGVSNNASQDEIKRAFRKLSLKYHPDKNKGNKENTETFKKINNAYQIIGNEEGRKKYDQDQQNPFMKHMHSNSGFNNMPPGNMDNVFKMFFANQSPFFNVHPNQTSNYKVFHNGKPIYFQNMMQKPPPIVKTIEITLTQSFNGVKIPIHIERWIQKGDIRETEKETLYFDVPRGIDNNELIILKDKGNRNQHGLISNIKIFVKIKNDTKFKRQGINLIYSKEISFKESLCGFSFDLKYFNDRTFKINNDPGNIIKPNFKKMIPSMGLVRDGKKGDLLIEFIVQYPNNITVEQATQISKILS